MNSIPDDDQQQWQDSLRHAKLKMLLLPTNAHPTNVWQAFKDLNGEDIGPLLKSLPVHAQKKFRAKRLALTVIFPEAIKAGKELSFFEGLPVKDEIGDCLLKVDTDHNFWRRYTKEAFLHPDARVLTWWLTQLPEEILDKLPLIYHLLNQVGQQSISNATTNAPLERCSIVTPHNQGQRVAQLLDLFIPGGDQTSFRRTEHETNSAIWQRLLLAPYQNPSLWVDTKNLSVVTGKHESFANQKQLRETAEFLIDGFQNFSQVENQGSGFRPQIEWLKILQAGAEAHNPANPFWMQQGSIYRRDDQVMSLSAALDAKFKLQVELGTPEVATAVSNWVGTQFNLARHGGRSLLDNQWLFDTSIEFASGSNIEPIRTHFLSLWMKTTGNYQKPENQEGLSWLLSNQHLLDSYAEYLKTNVDDLLKTSPSALRVLTEANPLKWNAWADDVNGDNFLHIAVKWWTSLRDADRLNHMFKLLPDRVIAQNTQGLTPIDLLEATPKDKDDQLLVRENQIIQTIIYQAKHKLFTIGHVPQAVANKSPRPRL